MAGVLQAARGYRRQFRTAGGHAGVRVDVGDERPRLHPACLAQRLAVLCRDLRLEDLAEPAAQLVVDLAELDEAFGDATDRLHEDHAGALLFGRRAADLYDCVAGTRDRDAEDRHRGGCRDVEVLAVACDVVARLALNGVRAARAVDAVGQAVAALQRVVAAAALDVVAAATAVDRVAPRAAREAVVATRAGERIVTRTAGELVVGVVADQRV